MESSFCDFLHLHYFKIPYVILGNMKTALQQEVGVEPPAFLDGESAFQQSFFHPEYSRM